MMMMMLLLIIMANWIYSDLMGLLRDDFMWDLEFSYKPSSDTDWIMEG